MLFKLIDCPRCQGHGWVRISSAYVLLGLPILFDKLCTLMDVCDEQDEATKSLCPRCDGWRQIRIRVR